MDMNKEKIQTAIDRVNEVCAGCGSGHSNECPVSIAREALESLR